MDNNELDPPRPRRPRQSALPLLLAATAMMGGGFFGNWRPSASSVRHDPNREKTPQDLANIEAARLRREKRAAKKQKYDT